MSKYSPSDDGKTIDGKIVVFVWPPGGAPEASSSAPGSDKGSAKDGSSGGTTAAAGAANEARSYISRDGGLAAKNAVLSDQNAAAAAQAKTLADAAKAAVPFCEKCAAAGAEGHPEEASQPDPAAAATPAAA